MSALGRGAWALCMEGSLEAAGGLQVTEASAPSALDQRAGRDWKTQGAVEPADWGQTPLRAPAGGLSKQWPLQAPASLSCARREISS